MPLKHIAVDQANEGFLTTPKQALFPFLQFSKEQQKYPGYCRVHSGAVANMTVVIL